MADSKSPAARVAERRREQRRETGQVPVIDPALEESLRSAEQARDLNALAEVVAAAASRLEALGRIEQGLAELEYAAVRVARNPDARSIILGTKATFALGVGDEETARSSLEAARRCEPTDWIARRYLSANGAMLGAQLLDPQALDSFDAALELTDSDEAEHLHTFVLSWWIPSLFAAGRALHASPWERVLEDYANRWIHPHRLTDAAVFRAARGHIRHPEREWNGDNIPMTATNWAGRLRVAALNLHSATLRRSWASSSIALGALDEVRRKHYQKVTGDLVFYRSATDVARGKVLEFSEEPPTRRNLLTLGALLAGAEAAAKAATPSLATSWLRAIEALPEWVESSLEWPVSRRRVMALLLARTGATRDAIATMRSAAEWAKEAGYPAERALSLVQLGTLMSLADYRARERTWRGYREEGWKALLEMGVDPATHAYDAGRTLELAGERNTPPLLSPREIETLKWLAEGLSYKEAALKMDCGWRTVQTLAHRAYGKLDVGGRHQAVQTARARGLL